MKKLLLVAALWLGSMALPFGQTYSFDVKSVTEFQLVSHERLRFTIDTYNAFFPYSGMIGWRLLFSQYTMGDSDPQYQYAVWALPARDSDISQEFYIVRPAGLTGKWYVRIDAVDAARKPLATSHEFTHEFSTPEVEYKGMIYYIAQDKSWSASLGLTNPTDKVATATFTFYSQSGDPYTVDHGANSFSVEIPAHAVWAGHLGSFLPGDFYGSVKLQSDAPLGWEAIMAYGTNPAGMIMQGVLK